MLHLHPSYFEVEILMPHPQDIAPTYDQVIENILREVSAPMSVLDLAQKIFAAHPSASKDSVKAAEQKIKEAVGRQLVYLDSNTIAADCMAGSPLSHGLEPRRSEQGLF
jgi:hypothetical protein